MAAERKLVEPKSPTVIKLKGAKNQLEIKLGKLIQEFEQEYGVQVTQTRVTRQEGASKRIRIVEVTVEL